MPIEPGAELPRVGVCHAPGAAANLVELHAAAEGTCTVVLLVRQAVAESAPHLVDLARELFECRVVADDATAAGFGLDGVTTFHDDELDLADRLAGPAEPSPWDKLRQRDLLAAAGLSSITALAVDTARDLTDAFERLRGPGVLKPRRAAGGRGVAFVDDHDDLRHQLARRTRWSGLLLEDRIETVAHPAGRPWLGELLSVETASVGTQRVHLGVLDKLPVAVTRRDGPDGADTVRVQGDILPSAVPPDLRARAMDLTSRALDALGVRSRLTHTELLLTANGLEVLEVNGRLAGHTARLFALTGGPDLVRIALRLATGAPPRIEPGGERIAAGLFPAFPDQRGAVRSVVDPDELRAVPGVAGVHELATAGTPRSATGGRLANLTVTAADHGELDGVVRAVLATLGRLFAEDLRGAQPVLTPST